jgi:hypothetical protein
MSKAKYILTIEVSISQVRVNSYIDYYVIIYSYLYYTYTKYILITYNTLAKSSIALIYTKDILGLNKP